MAKPSAFWAKVNAAYEYRLKKQREHCIQQCRDIMVIAANKEFGFGSERAKRLLETFDSVFLAYAFEVIEDAKADKAIEYSKSRLDGALKQILGENFVPWEERYNF